MKVVPNNLHRPKMPVYSFATRANAEGETCPAPIKEDTTVTDQLQRDE